MCYAAESAGREVDFQITIYGSAPTVLVFYFKTIWLGMYAVFLSRDTFSDAACCCLREKLFFAYCTIHQAGGGLAERSVPLQVQSFGLLILIIDRIILHEDKKADMMKADKRNVSY